MPNFCKQCGSPVGSTAFCGTCGAAMLKDELKGPQPAAASALQPTLASQPTTASPAKGGMGTGMKLLLAAGAIVVIGGMAAAAGVFVVAHRVSQKFHEVTSGITGSSPRDAAAGSISGGDPCRYLSKQDVGQAIGVEIVGTQADGEACSYMAKGNQGDMSAKHAAAMLGAKGADAKTQKMVQDFASGMFNSMPQEKQDQSSDNSGKVPVLSMSVSDSPSAIAEMKLNAKVMKNLGGRGMPATGEDLDIGDQAFVSSDSVIMVRIGGKVIRIMYMTCPCGTKDVIPLAKKVVQSL